MSLSSKGQESQLALRVSTEALNTRRRLERQRYQRAGRLNLGKNAVCWVILYALFQPIGE